MYCSEEQLTTLDSWYHTRVDRYYTPEVEEAAIHDIIGEGLAFALFMRHCGAIEKLRRDRLLETSQTYFSDSYHTLSRLQGLAELMREDVSNGVYNEYISPMFEAALTMQDFLRATAEQPGNKQGIENAFCQVFHNADGYASFTNNIIRTHSIAAQLCRQKSPINQNQYLRAYRKINIRTARALFGDLHSETHTRTRRV